MHSPSIIDADDKVCAPRFLIPDLLQSGTEDFLHSDWRGLSLTGSEQSAIGWLSASSTIASMGPTSPVARYCMRQRHIPISSSLFPLSVEVSNVSGRRSIICPRAPRKMLLVRRVLLVPRVQDLVGAEASWSWDRENAVSMDK